MLMKRTVKTVNMQSNVQSHDSGHLGNVCEYIQSAVDQARERKKVASIVTQVGKPKICMLDMDSD